MRKLCILNDLAMVVVSCDAYSDIGTIYFELQNKYMGWFQNPRYFINESKNVSFPGVTVIHVGNDMNWSYKVSHALQLIPEKYILFMLEDYFIGKEVKQEYIIEALSLMQQNNLRYYKITNIPKINRNSKIANYLAPIPSNLRYGINLQAAFFDKSFLLDIISGPDRSAWATETDLLKYVTDRYEYDIPGCVLDKRNIIDIHNGIIKGKWVPDTISYFKKIGYTFELGKRPVLSFWEDKRIKMVGAFSHILPGAFVKKLKLILKQFGIHFVSEN